MKPTAQLEQARGQIMAVREGRIHSARWLLSEIEVERALVAEAKGDSPERPLHSTRR